MANTTTPALPEVGRFLRQREVLALLGVSRITLWQWRRKGIFPQPRHLGPRLVAWPIEEIRAWQNSRPAA